MPEKELDLVDGKKIPSFGIGTWQLAGKNCEQAVRTALESGYRQIDTAEAYKNQKEIGKAINGIDRSKFFLTSKVWIDHLKHNDLLKACDSTLKELQTDYLDLYLVHWPNKKIPLTETFSAMESLQKDGRIKSFGVSNFTIKHLEEALLVSKKIAVNQVEFHPYLYQRELLEFCKRNKIVLTAYSPLGRKTVLKDKIVQSIAEKCNKTPAQVCLNWILQKGIVAIPKASSKEHLLENMGCLEFDLSKQDIEAIDSLGKNQRLVNPWFAEFNKK